MENILIYGSIFDMTDKMTDEQVGKLFKAINKWRGGTEPEFDDPMLIGVWMGISPNLEQLKSNYDTKVAANRENGKKGGRPKKVTTPTQQEEIKVIQEKSKDITPTVDTKTTEPVEIPAVAPEPVAEEILPTVPVKELSGLEADISNGTVTVGEPMFDPMSVLKPAYNGSSEAVLEYLNSINKYNDLTTKDGFTSHWNSLKLQEDRSKFKSATNVYWMSDVISKL